MDKYDFNISFEQVPNAQLVNPPNPKFIVLPKTENNIKIDTNFKRMPVAYIYSRREPYVVDHYWGDYGSLGSKLGTNLGS